MEASSIPIAYWSFGKKPVYEHGSGCGGQGTGERLAIKPVSSRLEDYPFFFLSTIRAACSHGA